MLFCTNVLFDLKLIYFYWPVNFRFYNMFSAKDFVWLLGSPGLRNVPVELLLLAHVVVAVLQIGQVVGVDAHGGDVLLVLELLLDR